MQNNSSTNHPHNQRLVSNETSCLTHDSHHRPLQHYTMQTLRYSYTATVQSSWLN